VRVDQAQRPRPARGPVPRRPSGPASIGRGSGAEPTVTDTEADEIEGYLRGLGYLE
jgi:hypothetical protein